ncbi:hypothetical protein TIFTF001_029294 [Ficus carica]|uniref:Uncharacterized protein n=1 Tax=Ficus carica TaxID=3494 RepID=A0AA88J2A0_FICCA|nr:hypothetical protein TIFTF001_029294 [Ficus carica]
MSSPQSAVTGSMDRETRHGEIFTGEPKRSLATTSPRKEDSRHPSDGPSSSVHEVVEIAISGDRDHRITTARVILAISPMNVTNYDTSPSLTTTKLLGLAVADGGGSWFADLGWFAKVDLGLSK